MDDTPSDVDVPVQRRTVLRTATLASLPVAGASSPVVAQEDECENTTCDQQIGCFTPSEGHPLSDADSDVESPDGIDSVVELGAMALYRGTVPYGGDDCRPVWDILVSWRQFKDDRNFLYNLDIDINTTDTGDVVNTQDASNVRTWFQEDPDEISGIDPDASDEKEELEQYYETEGALDYTPYNEVGLLVSTLATAGSIAAGGPVGAASISILGALTGLALSEEVESSEDDTYHIDYNKMPDQGQDVGFFYLPNITGLPKQDRPVGELNELEVDLDLYLNDSRADFPEKSFTLDLGWREDDPTRVTGELQANTVTDADFEIRNTHGEVLDTASVTFDDTTGVPDYEDASYDFWVSSDEFPLRIQETNTSVTWREIWPGHLDGDLEPYETIDQDFSAGPLEPDCVDFNGGTVCDVNGDDLYRDVTGDESVTNGDVVDFFGNQHTPSWKRPDLFDFGGDGNVGQHDVLALFQYVTA